MAKKTYTIDFTVTLGWCECVEAKDRAQAYEIAHSLLASGKFYDHLIENWNDYHSGWNMPNEPFVFDEEGEVTLTEAKIAEYVNE